MSASGLCQKIYLFDKNLALAWSGSLIQAQKLAKFVAGWRKVKGKGLSSLRRCLDQYPPSETSDIQCFFVIRVAYGTYEYLDVNNVGWDQDGISDVRILGSGTSHFFQWMDHICSWHREIGNIDYGIAKILSLIGIDMVRQYHMDIGVAENWGGCFDLLVGYPDGLKKISPIHYYFMNWVEQDDTIKPDGFAPFFTMISYKDVLFAISQEGSLTYPIPSLIDDKSTKGKLLKLKFKPGWHCITARSVTGILSSLVVDKPHKNARLTATPTERSIAYEYLELLADHEFTYIPQGQPPEQQKSNRTTFLLPAPKEGSLKFCTSHRNSAEAAI